MKYLLVFILLLSTNSCREADKTSNKKLVHNKKLTIDEDQEYIDNVKLNGLINFKDTYKNATRYLGKPDSVVFERLADSLTKFPAPKVAYYYFNGIRFQNYNDTLILLGVDFRKAKTAYLQTSNHKLCSLTTFSDFKKWFPVSANHQLSGTDMDISIAITISASKASQNQWILYFDTRTERLAKTEYWVPD